MKEGGEDGEERELGGEEREGEEVRIQIIL